MSDEQDPQTILRGALDRIGEECHLARHKSIERTDVCTIWDPHEQLWIESDADLRVRVKERLR